MEKFSSLNYNINSQPNSYLSKNSLSSFNFLYPKGSSQFEVCLNDSSDNFLGVQNIQIRNTNFNYNNNNNGNQINYNNVKYWFKGLYIIKPGISIFDFNNKNKNNIDLSSSSIIIQHTNSDSTKNLFIYLPLKLNDQGDNNSNFNLSALITNVITDITSNSDNNKCLDSNYLKLAPEYNLDLNLLIPTITKFYIFNNKFIFTDNTNTVSSESTILIFPNNNNSSLFVNSTTSTLLKNVFTNDDFNINTWKPINFHYSHSNSFPINILDDNVNSDIYIQCQPTDDQGETLIKQPTIPSIYNENTGTQIINSILSNFKDNVAVQIIIGIIFMVLILKLSEIIIINTAKSLSKKAN